MTDQATGATVKACPHFDFDPLVPHHELDPWPALEKARKEQPVFYSPELEMYVVTKYEDIRVMLRDTETFSNDGGNEIRTPVPDEVEIPPGCPYPRIGDQLPNIDPPHHTWMRKLMQYAFTPKRVGLRADDIRAFAHGLIDEFEADGQVDLVPAYSNKIPIAAIAMVLGFPLEKTGSFRLWTDTFLELLANPNLPHDRAVELWSEAVSSRDYIANYVIERRDNPQEDLISDLLKARDEEGKGLTDEQVIANTMSFVIAGTDTTATQITHQVMVLQEDRSRWDAVVADPTLVPKVVEETLRYLGPVRGLNRVVKKDAVLGGVDIPAGSRIFWMGASANRDEEMFERPDEFDIHRRNNSSHIGFGALKHFCIGAPLARMEAQIALEVLIERLPDLRVPDQDVVYPPNFIMPGPLHLQVEWTPKS